MNGKGSLKRLQLSNFKLDTLLNITQAINENLSTEGLLRHYEKIIREDLGIGKVILYSYNNAWQCILSSGIKDESYKEIVVENDLLHFREITNITTMKQPKLATFDVVIPVFHKAMPLAYLLLGDIEEERDGISPVIKHLHFFQTLTNIIVVAIENKRLYNEHVQQESIRKEMELASRMQTNLIPNPDSLPNNEFLYVAAYYQPHFEIGGDYYDCLKLNNDEYGFCIADVSGKGMSAALIMSNFQASLRALFTTEITLNELATRLNSIVMINTNGEKFITVFLAKYNTKTRKFHYINAGHIPPVFLSCKKVIRYLKEGCTGFGMLNEIPKITVGTLIIEPGSKLFLCTDGLVEMENENNVEFGFSEIERYLESEDSIDNSIWKIIQRLNIYKGRKPFFDDISVLAIKFL
ncbi:MAG: serine/threonine protein phosphatase [Bacteroidetes bacterium CG23_combo_of_CG06-09_8_20_14_all_32_9]|nr:MAG: serine/threonine protein phosphatase [Bacteroidetes bacterium CG23_combo_of_CG06-09_8_20_14_all_32_9]